jgi:hypothetical protein
LESEYVADTVWRLEARIRARFPDRRLGDVAAELGSAVPEIHDGFEQSKARRRQVRLFSRVASLVIVLLAVGALGLALRDAITRGTEHTFGWVPLV